MTEEHKEATIINCEMIMRKSGLVDVRMPGAHMHPLENMKKMTSYLMKQIIQTGNRVGKCRYTRPDGKEDVFRVKETNKGLRLKYIGAHKPIDANKTRQNQERTTLLPVRNDGNEVPVQPQQ